MPKKITAKQRREERERLNKLKWSKPAESAVSANNSQISTSDISTKDNGSQIKDKKTHKKTQAKAMGLKTILSFNDKIAIASFASTKDEKASHIERITDKEGTPIKVATKMFDSSVDKRNVNIKKSISIENNQINGLFQNDKKDVKSTICNPYFKMCGKDYIGIKEAAELRFFGKTFPNENLRVQIAYNIFDIQKILGTYINNIIYSFYNLSRNKEIHNTDIIGTLYVFADYDAQKNTETFNEAKALLQDTEAYYCYFDGVFKKSKKSKKNEGESPEYEKNLRYNFNVLRLLSILRQICMHARVDVPDCSNTNNSKMSAEALDVLFNISKYFGVAINGSSNEIYALLNDIYSNGINEINADFVTHSKNNVYILSKVYPEMKREDLLKAYYDFVVSKEHNNVGISTRKLKEAIISQNIGFIKDTTYDTYRNKLYTIMCFILVTEMNGCYSLKEEMINELRANMNGDDERDAIYSKYAEKVYCIAKNKLDTMLNVFAEETKGVQDDTRVEKDTKKFTNGKLDKDEIKGFCLSANNTEDITKIIYFLCKFLDGKEINELCCAMMNKFNGINDLIETAKQCGESVEFVDQYKCLSKCAEISDQIRIVKNISKIRKEITIDNDVIMCDALELLGHKRIEKYQIDSNGKREKDQNGKYVWSNDYKRFDDKFYNGKDHRLRNFVINNIIKSKWFFYVVRYNNPAECQKIMKNNKLVKFAFDSLPNLQIQRYYRSVFGDEQMLEMPDMRIKLQKKILNLSINGILDEIALLSKDEMERQDVSSEKEKNKSLIRLYLTIVYLITKSMVKINTRFSIACATLERDYELLCQPKDSKLVWKEGAQAIALTRKFLNHDKVLFEKHYKREGEIAKLPREERKPLRKENDQLLKDTHYTKHSYIYIVNNLNSFTMANYVYKNRELPIINEKNDNMKCFVEMRNNVMHLNIVHNMVDYVEEVKNITSYYAFYCYILQRIIVGDNPNEKNQLKAKYGKALQESGIYNKSFMWELNLPFAYNLPRYKNLSNEKLFYDEVENETI